MTTRLKTMTASFNPSQPSIVTLQFFSEPNAKGVQAAGSRLICDGFQIDNETIHARLVASGLATVMRSIVGDDRTGGYEKAQAAYKDMIAGTWAPSVRTARTPAEPTLLEEALARIFNSPVHLVQKHLQETLVLNADGTPKLTKNGKHIRKYTSAVLAAMAADKSVAPVLAQVLSERAAKARAAARSAKDDSDALASLRAEVSAPQAAEPSSEAEAA